MIVYCSVADCKHNKDRVCECEQPVGSQFITIGDTLMGPMCEDYESEEDDEHA